MKGLSELIARRGLPAQVVGEPVVFDMLFTTDPVIDYRSLQKADGAQARVLTTELIKRGVVKNTQKMYMSTRAHRGRRGEDPERLRGRAEALLVLLGSGLTFRHCRNVRPDPSR